MKKINTVLRKLKKPVKLDGKIISEIYFDLRHINYGWDKEKKDYNQGLARQNFTEEDVLDFFEQLDNLKQYPTIQLAGLASVEKRLVFSVFDNDKKYKMIVDLMKSSATVVVTIYK